MKWFLYSLRNFAKFEGRASRPEYWYFVLFVFLIFILLVIVDFSLGTYDEELGMGVTSAIFFMLVAIPSTAVGARRLHDTNRTGWWQLINLLPYIGSLILIALFSVKGQSEENRYGPPPSHEPKI